MTEKQPAPQEPERLPLLRHEMVYHVGTLDFAHRAQQYVLSLEGPCLSVSLCPEVWRAIAKLGNAPTWALSSATSQFLDVHAFKQAPVLWQKVQAWGISEGLCTEGPVWEARWEEDGDLLFIRCESEEQAIQEVDDPSEVLSDGKPAVNLVTALTATEALSWWVGVPLKPDRPVDDFLLMAWVEQVLPSCDGLWWQDRLDPASLSAPRGGILPSRLHRWTRAVL